MVELRYSGKIVSCNKRLIYNHRMKRMVSSPEYRNCLEEMSLSFMSQTRKRKLNKIDLEINILVNKRQDHHNLYKIIFDALERSGIILNDKYINKTLIIPEIKSNAENELYIKIQEVI